MSSAELSALSQFLHQDGWAGVALVLGYIYRKPVGSCLRAMAACLNAWASRLRKARK